MKLLTVIGFVALCASATAAAADAPRDGHLNSKARHERMAAANAARLDASDRKAAFAAAAAEEAAAVVSANTMVDNDDVVMSIRVGRRARQSCIPDFQRLCRGVGASIASPSISNSAAIRGFDAAAEDSVAPPPPPQKEAALPALGGLRRGGGGRVIGTNKKGLRLKGMEQCLTERYADIKNEKCKDFIDGRTFCFDEIDAEKGICQKYLDIAAGAKDSKGKARGAAKDAAIVGGEVIAAFRGFDGAAAAMEGKNDGGAAPSPAKNAVALQANALQLRIERAKMSCLRAEPVYRFTPQCTNSSYYKSLALPPKSGGGGSKKKKAPAAAAKKA